ncbi:MAG: hypothetical protein V7664_00910 [Qipengyuania sp.]|uniref:hypothetical protein n=1 Tax=Qipengyuania sp. TaxID=2004515 RepID=UPI00300265FE
MIETLVSAALGAGADRVVISAPNQPRCILSNNKFRPDLLGSKVIQLEQKLLGDHRGNLKLIGEPVPFSTPEGVKHLALGILEWDYASNPARPQDRTQVSAYVLVEWNSAQPAPPVGPDLIPVEGTLMSIDIDDYQALGDLAADHRLVRALFKVRGMRIYV